MDTTYLRYQPQWDLLQETSHGGSAAGWSCSPQTSPKENKEAKEKECGAGMSPEVSSCYHYQGFIKPEASEQKETRKSDR